MKLCIEHMRYLKKWKLLLLIGIMILAGCGKETEPEQKYPTETIYRISSEIGKRSNGETEVFL